MKTIHWEPFLLVPATFVLFFGFALLTQDNTPQKASATQALESQLRLNTLCSPLTVQPGQTERRWVCEQ